MQWIDLIIIFIIIFCSIHLALKLQLKNSNENSILNILTANGITGIITMYIIYPMEYARTRLALDIGRRKEERLFKNIRDWFSKTFKSDGVPGIYRGFVISYFGTIAYRTSYFALYDIGKVVFKIDSSSRMLYAWVLAISVTNLANLLTYPFDTIKRRLMMRSWRSSILYANIFHWISTIYKKEGWKGFYKGFLSSIFRSSGSSIILVLLDKIQNEFN